MKYDIFSESTKKVLGWAMTVESAEHRAGFFIDANPKILIRDNKTKKVVKTLTADDYTSKESEFPR